MDPFTLIPSVRDAIELQKDSIVSKTVHTNAHVKVVLMALDTGQELSEHTAAMGAIIQILEGVAKVGLGDSSNECAAGAWIYMEPGLRHAVLAIEPTVLLLSLIKDAK